MLTPDHFPDYVSLKVLSLHIYVFLPSYEVMFLGIREMLCYWFSFILDSTNF